MLQGFLQGFGFTYGAVAAILNIILLLIMCKSYRHKYDIDALLEAFKDFEVELQVDEQYELITPLRAIIKKIEETDTFSPSKGDFFTIRKFMVFSIGENDKGINTVGFRKEYQIDLKDNKDETLS